MTSTLRTKLIRLAHQKPELRPVLLPLLSKQAGDGDEVPSKSFPKDLHKLEEDFPGGAPTISMRVLTQKLKKGLPVTKKNVQQALEGVSQWLSEGDKWLKGLAEEQGKPNMLRSLKKFKTDLEKSLKAK